MRLLRPTAALLSATLLAACATPIPVPRSPDAGLLVLCERPVLSDPETATDNDFAGDFIKLDEALTVCARRHEDLVRFENAGKRS